MNMRRFRSAASDLQSWARRTAEEGLGDAMATDEIKWYGKEEFVIG